MADSDKSLYNLRYNQLTSNLEGFGGGSPQWTLLTLNNVDPQQVPVTRQINTTAPLQGGGNLTVDRTLSITEAGTSTDGYLSAVDWNTFNNKQTAGNYITTLTGDGTATGPGSVPLTLATVNGNVGTFALASITVNGKGLITSASAGATGSLTDVGTDGIVITGGTGAVIGSGTSIAQHVADATHNGYLSSTDWNTFNNKQSTLALGNLTDVGTDGITVTNGTGAVVGSGTSFAQHVADTTHNGYLSSADWNTFNGKQAAGSYITALTGDVTASGPGSAATTLANVNSNVGSFTNASITVNAKGLITAASNGVASGVTSVSGTTNQIDVATGTTTPVISLDTNLILPGTLKLGGALNANSNKITSLANGTVSTDAAAFGQIGGTAGVNAAGYIIGTIVQTVQFVDANPSTTTSTSGFPATTTVATIVPKASTHKIRITVSGTAIHSATGTDQWQGTILRNSTNLGNSQGMVNFGSLAATANETFSASFVYLDSPATTSSITYKWGLQNGSAARTVTWGAQGSGSCTQVILLEEIAA